MRYSKQELSRIRKASLAQGYPTSDRRIHKEPPVGVKYEPYLRREHTRRLSNREKRFQKAISLGLGGYE